jgi:hypothetical protein
VKNIILPTIASCLLAAPVFATPIGPAYPAPGGNNFSSTGSAGSTASSPYGAVGTYTNFDPSQFDALYWGLQSVKGPLNTASGSSQDFVFQSLSSTEAVWTAPSAVFIDNLVGPDYTLAARFRSRFLDMNGNNITGSAVLANSVGISGTPYVLAMNDASLASWGGGFKVTRLFEVQTGSTWTGVNDFFNNVQTPPCNGCVVTSTNGAFWSEAPVQGAEVPEPTSLMMLGSGIAFIGRRLVRRRTA